VLATEEGTTLSSDEASKLGKKVIAIAITDSHGNDFALGEFHDQGDNLKKEYY
jgi:hypothetical protein